MKNMIITSCEDIGIDQLHLALCHAFSDYVIPMQFSLAKLRFMLRQRGFSAHHSYVGIIDGKIAGFWLIGIHPDPAKSQAYAIVAGTLPELRGQGCSKRIFAKVAETLRQQAMKRLTLEVIQSNETAAAFYRKLGFKAIRLVSCFEVTRSQAVVPSPRSFGIKALDIRKVVGDIQSFWDWPPTWQNSPDAILRVAEDTASLGAYIDTRLIGAAALFLPNSALAQIAVDPEFRRLGVGRALMNALFSVGKTETIHIINADAADHPFRSFVEAIDGSHQLNQYEMMLSL